MVEACLPYIVEVYFFYIVKTTENKKFRHNFKQSSRWILIDG